MLKTIRKHNKWLIVGFGILLMIAFTAPELIQRVGHAAADRGVATLNGERIRLSDQARASVQLMALEQFAPAILGVALGLEPRDSTHWMLLVHEARQAGLVGGAGDGRDFLPEAALINAEIQLHHLQQADFQRWVRLVMDHDGDQEAVLRALASQYEEVAPRIFASAHMNREEMFETLAQLRGVMRLVIQHNRAARFSDRHAIVEAKQSHDSAVVDYVFLSAADLAREMPDPTPEELQAHFEEFKDTPPGGGDYGIGYLLPRRVQLEWLKLDREAIEEAVEIDPVEVSKEYMRRRLRYTGEFSEERPRVEADMRRAMVERIFQSAHGAINAEVLRATRRLEQDGPFRRLPPNWDDVRPRMEDLAETIVEAVARTDGPRIPRPEVQILGDRWLTEQDVAGLSEIGQTFVQRGERRFGAAQVIFSVREFVGLEGPIPVQAGIPLVENYLQDWAGNRYYLTIIDTREVSPPDSVDEIREQAVRDYKRLAAYQQLKVIAEDMASVARAEGLQAVMAAAPVGAEETDVRTNVRVSRDTVEGGDPNLEDPAARAAIVDAAAEIDPLAPTEEMSPQITTLAVPSDRALGLIVAQIRAKVPLTVEEFRRFDASLVTSAQQRELWEAGEDEGPFSVTALLRRHHYVVADRRITSADDLREADEREWEFDG